MLALEDLKDYTPKKVIEHLIANYSGKESGMYASTDPNDEDRKDATKRLKGMKVLIAYESVGDYGCDSSSFYLLKKGKNLFEVHGSHCSCYGFEGQLTLEPTTVKALKARVEKGGLFSIGGYDSGGWNDDKNPNYKAAINYIKKMKG